MYQGLTLHYLRCGFSGDPTTVGFRSDIKLGCENKINVADYLRIPQYVERKPPLQILGDKPKRKLGYGSDSEASPKKLKSLFDDDDDDDECNYNTQAWINKRVESWSLLDTKNWLYITSQEMGQLYRELSPKFARTGEELLLLSRQDFANIDSNFGGMLYDSLHQIVEGEIAFWSSEVPYRLKTGNPVHQIVDGERAFWSSEVPYRLKTSNPRPEIVEGERSFWSSEVPYRLKTVSEIKVEPASSDEEAIRRSECRFADEEEPPTIDLPVKQRGEKCRRANTSTRARTDVRTAGLKIWEFIRNLLLDPNYCPAWICWENYEEKSFRFIENEKIARLWGSRNNNKKMNYRDFSRAMRYHYKMNKLAMVRPPRKLVYKFGPEAIGLETDDPNFKLYHRYKEKGLPE